MIEGQTVELQLRSRTRELTKEQLDEKIEDALNRLSIITNEMMEYADKYGTTNTGNWSQEFFDRHPTIPILKSACDAFSEIIQEDMDKNTLEIEEFLWRELYMMKTGK